MSRPRTIRGLLIRLIRAYPGHAMGLAIALALLVMIVSHRHPVTRCNFVQTWSAGDADYHERLRFGSDGSGLWLQGDRHGEERRISFRWEKSDTTVTITAGNDQRTLGYELERRDKGCLLRFEQSPFPGSLRELHAR